LRKRTNNIDMANSKQWFKQLQEPDVHQTIENIDVNVFYLDNYPFKDEALKQQLFFMQADKSSISLLLEKEIYDLIPEYYSAPSLLIVHQYYMSIYRKKVFPAFGIGLAVAITFGLISDLFNVSVDISGLLSLGLGTFTMLFLLTYSMRRQQTKARLDMRERLTKLHGDRKLNAYLERQEKYMEERRASLSAS
jgi:hypothetical protein